MEARVNTEVENKVNYLFSKISLDTKNRSRVSSGQGALARSLQFFMPKDIDQFSKTISVLFELVTLELVIQFSEDGFVITLGLNNFHFPAKRLRKITGAQSTHAPIFLKNNCYYLLKILSKKVQIQHFYHCCLFPIFDETTTAQEKKVFTTKWTKIVHVLFISNIIMNKSQ